MEEKKYLLEMFRRHPELKQIEDDIWKSFVILKDAYINKGKILTCGNGGSAADADHIVGELMKGFCKKRELSAESREIYGDLSDALQEGLPAIALTQHTALITAYSNDMDPDMIFAQQVYIYGNREDVLWAITTSGNSPNVINASRVAKKRGLKVIGMTGLNGGALKEITDVCISVPEKETAFAQEKHLIIYHALCAMLEEYFF